MSRHDEEAVSIYPELHALIAMREVGWRFRPWTDSSGEIDRLDGFRRADRWTDMIRVRDRADALGRRLLPDGRVLWERHGALDEVVGGLMSLPVR